MNNQLPVTRLSLEAFDEYTNLREYFPEEFAFVVLTGKNGSGKTSFLNAISKVKNNITPIYVHKGVQSEVLTENWMEWGYTNLNSTRHNEVYNLLAKIVPNYTHTEKYFKLKFTLRYFSDGQKKIMFIVINMLSNLFNMKHNKDVRLANLRGIVLIDDIENYLCPSWQKEFVRLLGEFFPKVQFIVTTNSAVTFLGLPNNSIAYRVTNNVEQGIRANLVNIDFANLMPNHLLSSPLFDLDIIPTSNTDTNKIATTDTYSEHVARQEVTEKLQQLANKLNERK